MPGGDICCFFQAEDGIRDVAVTGVQTCALPISMWYVGLRVLGVPLAPLWAGLAAVLQFVPHLGPALGMVAPTITAAIHWGDWRHPQNRRRACWGRGEDLGVGGSFKKKNRRG